MNCGTAAVRSSRMLIWAAALTLGLAGRAGAQGTGARAQGTGNVPAAATRAPRAAAPQDLTGYWESIVTEFWRLCMVVLVKSDYVTFPLNAEGRKTADA